MELSLNGNNKIARIGFLILILLGTLVVTFVVIKLDAKAVVVPIALIGLVMVFFSFLDTTFGLLALIFYSFFIFLVKRYFGEHLPLGIVVELLLIVTFGGIVTKKVFNRDYDWSFLVNPISVVYLIWVGYMIIQLFNPNMHSIDGWIFYVRKIGGYLMGFMIGLYLFRDLKVIQLFLKIWLILAFLAAVYGCYQEWFGFFPFEDRWIRASEVRFNLIFAGWRFRKFSFLSDPTSFGVHMAATAILCIIFLTGPIRKRYKTLYAIAALFMLLSMSYSGTRTAYVMVPAGIAIYSLLTINRKSTLILSAASILVFIFILYGPIYGNKVVDRIRSTFEPSEDESYQVREENRHRIQPYMYAHPIGGGMATTGVVGMIYNPNHELAGFPPDSAYVATVLETGWIGLILRLSIYFVIFRVAISSYYRMPKGLVKTYYAGLISMVFALVVALYAQQSPTGQLPMSTIFYPVLAIIANMRLVKEPEKVD